MDEILLPAMRSHVPGLPTNSAKPTWHLPIHVYTKSGVDIDYGPLLLFDRAIVDSHSFEYVLSSRRPELKPLSTSLKILSEEGYLEARDFGKELDIARPLISDHVEKILSEPLDFREPYLRGIDGYRTNIGVNSNIFSGYDPSWMALGFGLHIYLANHFGKIDLQEKDRLDKLMVSQKARWRRQDIDDIKELMRPTITYLYQNLALSEMYETPFIDATYTSELYRILCGGSLKAFDRKEYELSAKVREAQNLFNVCIPQIRPTSPQKMLKLLRQKSIKDFRDFVSEAAKRESPFTRDEYNSILIEVVRAHNKLNSIKGAIAWGERTLSLVPGIGHFAAGLGIIAEKIAHRKMPKKNEWLYALINATPSDED